MMPIAHDAEQRGNGAPVRAGRRDALRHPGGGPEQPIKNSEAPHTLKAGMRPLHLVADRACCRSASIDIVYGRSWHLARLQTSRHTADVHRRCRMLMLQDAVAFRDVAVSILIVYLPQPTTEQPWTCSSDLPGTW